MFKVISYFKMVFEYITLNTENEIGTLYDLEVTEYGHPELQKTMSYSLIEFRIAWLELRLAILNSLGAMK